MAEVENIPDLNDIPLADITPTNRAAKHPCKGTKRPAMIMDAEDSDLEVEGTSSAPPAKRTREGKNDAIKYSLNQVQTCSEKAMDQCSSMFGEELSDDEYIRFINVLESKNKARTFLTLACSLTQKRCKIWLKKEASKTVSSSAFNNS
ncbi:hypothetical protein VP01_5g3 [Puccinia sorghi]|uniref:Uncharacterized protein n=1 Tax=Puccinia sorghi TaxID=27349 RepID=A0A0L6UHF7_9BASI|nr:hypothetical protein VP01_5g3 [Puccinia sorghi]